MDGGMVVQRGRGYVVPPFVSLCTDAHPHPVVCSEPSVPAESLMRLSQGEWQVRRGEIVHHPGYQEVVGVVVGHRHFVSIS